MNDSLANVLAIAPRLRSAETRIGDELSQWTLTRLLANV